MGSRSFPSVASGIRKVLRAQPLKPHKARAETIALVQIGMAEPQGFLQEPENVMLNCVRLFEDS